MPVVSVGRDRLFKALGKHYSKATAVCKTPRHDVPEVEPFYLLQVTTGVLAAAEDEFQQLCFEYGIELDDVVSLPQSLLLQQALWQPQPALTAAMPAGD